MENAKTSVHAFVTSKLDNCKHSCMACLSIRSSPCNTSKYVLTSTARLVTLSRKHDHISPVLMELPWLPVEQRVEVKVLLFTCKVVNDTFIDLAVALDQETSSF